jgi:hypothetical protein
VEKFDSKEKLGKKNLKTAERILDFIRLGLGNQK